ncbi:MauE/DoxX family redox-associated membrane protein, partial [Actinomadura darangshiensis]|uniref:MauE/DoxX family redox-associated membrane protein n=1 Tax=Actinomadura darangshiensis TaxID=705336 RepID=UPI00312CC145
VPVLLALPGAAGAGFVLAGLLASAFTAALPAALRRRDRAPCHCFGGSARPVGGVHLVRNVVLAAAAIAGLFGGAAATGTPEPAGAVAAVVAGAVLAALAVTADDVAELFRPVSADVHHATKGMSR